MRKEVEYFVTTLHSILQDTPWYGEPIMKILQVENSSVVYKKPNENSHSLIELLYHMNTWAEFTLKRLVEDEDLETAEKLDWREIDPKEHTWEKGVAQFKVTHDLIIELLESKDDKLLSEKVDGREYNFRFLLHGLIQHDIYHAGQIAYVKKLLS